MTVDFSQLLSDKVDSVKRPTAKPPGTYHAVIQGYVFGDQNKNNTPYVRFTFGNITPGEDIAPDQLQIDDEPIDLSKWKPTADFYITPDAKWRLTELIKAIGVPTEGRSINEVLPEVRNMPVVLTVSIRPSQDGTQFFNRIDQVSGQQ